MEPSTSKAKELEAKIQHEFEREFADIELARDEIRLTVHLGGMDAKTAWRELEKKLLLLEERVAREGSHVAEATRELAKEIKQSLKDFQSRLV